MDDGMKFVPDEHGGHLLNGVTGDKWYPESHTISQLEQQKAEIDRLKAALTTAVEEQKTPHPRDTAELVERLRNYDNCHDGDVDDAAYRLEYLQEIVDAIPALIELVAHDCGKEYCDRPSIYQRGQQWRYHRVRAGNEWNDADTPLSAALGAGRSLGGRE